MSLFQQMSMCRFQWWLGQQRSHLIFFLFITLPFLIKSIFDHLMKRTSDIWIKQWWHRWEQHKRKIQESAVDKFNHFLIFHSIDKNAFIFFLHFVIAQFRWKIYLQFIPNKRNLLKFSFDNGKMLELICDSLLKTIKNRTLITDSSNWFDFCCSFIVKNSYIWNV